MWKKLTRTLSTRNSGFLLVELLVATLLFSLAGSGIYTGFLEGIRAEKKVKESFKTYDPLRLLFLRLDEDLRNTAELTDYPFEGKAEEIRFPALLDRQSLFLVRYFVKDRTLIRSEEELNPKLSRERRKEKVLLKDFESLRFEFPYLEEESLVFESFWLSRPYYGIPRSVKVILKRGGETLEKFVSLPAGRMGHLRED